MLANMATEKISKTTEDSNRHGLVCVQGVTHAAVTTFTTNQEG
jgi:hypothetical protein